MGCCLCFLWGSKSSWIPLLVPIFAVYASFSSNHGSVLFVSISLSLLFILLSTLVLCSFTKQNQNQILVENTEFSPQKENTLLSISSEKSHEQVSETAQIKEEKEEEEENAKTGLFLIKSQQQDVYSESESIDHFSTSSTEEYYNNNQSSSSDVECWPYSNSIMEHNKLLDFSDDSISDEESLIEIAINPTEKVNLKYLNFSLQKYSAMDFISDMNEEDNLIEIDIYMGSIKSSNYQI